jgi:membrane-bound serine protease (ClpP class)
LTWPIVLLVVGLVLILLEFLFPSFGALGVAAALCLIGAVSWAFAQDPTFRTWLLAGTAVGVPVAIVAGMKLLPRSPLGRVLVNRGATFVDGAAVDRRDAALLGREGRADSLLRPAGTATFDGRRVDVVSRGEPIEAGTRVRVLEVSGNRVVVARAEPPPAA